MNIWKVLFYTEPEENKSILREAVSMFQCFNVLMLLSMSASEQVNQTLPPQVRTRRVSIVFQMFSAQLIIFIRCHSMPVAVINSLFVHFDMSVESRQKAGAFFIPRSPFWSASASRLSLYSSSSLAPTEEQLCFIWPSKYLLEAVFAFGCVEKPRQIGETANILGPFCRRNTEVDFRRR